jgi:hypothetical protein
MCYEKWHLSFKEPILCRQFSPNSQSQHMVGIQLGAPQPSIEREGQAKVRQSRFVVVVADVNKIKELAPSRQ